jgi:hypothetical protein
MRIFGIMGIVRLRHTISRITISRTGISCDLLKKKS